MILKESIEIVEQAINAAFVKGVYNMQDADMILQALKTLQPLKEEPKKQ